MKKKMISVLTKINLFRVFFELYTEMLNVIEIRNRCESVTIALNNKILCNDLSAIIIGKNTSIGAYNVFCVLNGKNNDLINNVKLAIGSHTYIGEQNNIRATLGSIYIGNNCLISQQVSIISSDHGYDKSHFIKDQDWTTKGDIIIEDDVWIGASSQILSGVTIGKGAIIAAGSLVNKNVEPFTIVGGIPARFIKNRE